MATLDTIRRVTVQAAGAGDVERLRDALLGLADAETKVGAAGEAMGRSTESTDRRMLSALRSFEGLERRVDPLARGMRDVARDLGIVATAMNQGAASAERTGTVVDALRQKLQGLGTAGASAVDQTALNRLLGVSDAVGKSASEAASTFDAELSRMDDIARMRGAEAGAAWRDGLNSRLGIGQPGAAASGATFQALDEEMRRIEMIEGARSAQFATSSQQDVNDLFGIGRSGGSARASAAVFEDSIREAEGMAASAARLRSEIDPMGAAFDRMNAALLEYQRLASAGAISTEELGLAQGLARRRFDEEAAGIRAVGRAGQMSTGQLVGMQYQLNDVAVSLASGQSPFVVMMQQGMQVSQMFAPGTSLATAGTNIAAGFMSMLTPINLAVVGVAALAGGVGYLWSAWKSDAPTIEDALENHTKLIRELREAYGDAQAAVEDYGGRSRDVLRFLVDEEAVALRKQNQRGVLGLFNGTIGSFDGHVGSDQTLAADTGASDLDIKRRFQPFEEAIRRLHEEAVRGQPDIVAFQEAVADTAGAEGATKAWREAGKELVDLTAKFEEAQRKAEAVREELGRFGNAFDAVRGGASTAPEGLQGEMARLDEAARARIELRKDAEATLRGAEAGLSNAGLTDYARGLAEIGQRYAELRRQAQEAGTLDVVGGFLDRAEAAELAAAAKSVETAWAQAIEEYGRTTEAMAGEAALWGRSTYEIERYKATLELTTLARQNDGVVTEAEIAMIRQEASARASAAHQIAAAEYERQQALERGNTAAQTGRSVTQGLISDFREGASATEKLTNALDRLADSFIDMSLDSLFRSPQQTPGGMTSGGPLYQLWGSALGGLIPANQNVPGAPAPVAAVPPAGSPDAVAYGLSAVPAAAAVSPGAALPASVEAYRASVTSSAAQHGVDPALALAVMTAESRGNASAVSPAGAIGLMQLMPGTAAGLGVDPYDPGQNIDGGVRYLSQMSGRYGGDTTRTLAAYNWGPGRVDNWNGDMAALPAETRDYIARVNEYLPKFDEATAGIGNVADASAEAARQSAAAAQSVSGFGGTVGALPGVLGEATSALGGTAAPSTGGGLFGWLGSLFGGGAATGAPMLLSGALAGGGSAMAGGTYLVGERGPELFRPDQSGTVIPNHALGAMRAMNDGAPREAGGVAGMTIVVKVDGARGDREIREMARQGAGEAVEQFRKRVLPKEVPMHVNKGLHRTGTIR